jgi:hypothetical protein
VKAFIAAVKGGDHALMADAIADIYNMKAVARLDDVPAATKEAFRK